jgi:CheY-like chemotaxis protein
VVLQLDLPHEGALRLLQVLGDDPAGRVIPVLAHHSRRVDPAHQRLLLAHAQKHPLELVPSLDELRERITLHLTAAGPHDVAPLAVRETPRQLSLEVPVSDGRLTGRSVLLVDDDARNVFAVTSMLEFYGMRVLSAENGREGIEALRENPDVDLILMDVMMPEMDGYTATAAIRSMAEYANLPIIAVTAKAMQGDREKSLAAGATAYVTKPVNTKTLIDSIRRCLEV